MVKPNLFDFATSELSQDAFLCWMAALADHDDGELARLGRAFIAWLWNNARGEAVDANAIQLLGSPRRQVHHIDILFDARVDGRAVLFLIEDKTSTSHHSGQLERYRAAVGQRDAVPIYFKTGYHFGADTSAMTHGYTVIGLSQWVDFLRRHRLDNDIFADYLASIERQLERRELAIARLFTPDGFDQLGHDFAQYELVKRLAGACARTIGPGAINRGVNRNGTPWAHFRFAELESRLPDGAREILFHRIDQRSSRFYLCTRQYARVKGLGEVQTEKLRRRNFHAALFKEAVAETASGLEFATPSRRGANESEVGILFFDGKANTTLRVIERFPVVHEAFVQKLVSATENPDGQTT